jgi:hypothetical protein
MKKVLKPSDTAIKKAERVQTEKQVVASCTAWLRKNGWITRTLYTGGIPLGGGRLGTNPAKGIPDCLILHISLKKLIWVEYKKSKGGILSPEQRAWHKSLGDVGQTVIVVNSLKSLKEQLNVTLTTLD